MMTTVALTENGRALDARYSLRDEARRGVEIPGERLERVAEAVAEGEPLSGDARRFGEPFRSRARRAVRPRGVPLVKGASVTVATARPAAD